MTAKNFISTLKGYRTKFSNKPNESQEKKQVTTLVENYGGEKLAVAALAKDAELKEYLNRVLAYVPTETPASESTEGGDAEKTVTIPFTHKGKEFVRNEEGNLYEVNNVDKTVKQVADDFLPFDEIQVKDYQQYLRDKFPGEDAPIKKGRLHFRGYRIYFDDMGGFTVEDTENKYATVDTGLEGIPSPKELCEWFDKKGTREFTPEENREAVERGKEDLKKRREASESAATSAEDEEVDLEALREKVLNMLEDAKDGGYVDLGELAKVIPFKRWKKSVNALIKKYKAGEIRHKELLTQIQQVTEDETFTVEEKAKRFTFTGTLLPEHKSVGLLVGDKIEVDGKWVPAVPFLMEYLLHYEPKAMPQLMKFAKGEISETDLLKNPLALDWRVEYDKKAWENNAHNARLLSMVYQQVGIMTPQDLLFEADVEVGDKILLIDINGNLVRRTISKVENGIEIGGEIGLTKLDKWVKLPKKEKETSAE